MVVFQIIIHARTQKVQSIQMPADGEWHFKIKCSGCGQQFPKEVSISTTQKIQVIKQEVNFQAKCKNCSRKSTILILPASPYKVSPDQYGNVKHKLALFDCRGVEITEVVIGNSLTVTCTSGTVYQNADFKQMFVKCSDLWAEYDDKLGQLCQVEDVKFIINRV